MKRLLSVLIVLVLLLSACAGEDSPQLNFPSDPDAMVLQVRWERGFVPAEFTLSRVPRFTLLADGRLLFEGPQIEIFPAPLLPNIQSVQLDDSTIDLIKEYILGIGFPDIVFERNDEAASNIADAPDDVVTYVDANGEHVFSVYALQIHEQFTDARVVQLRDLVNLLEQATFSGAGAGSYVPDRLQVFASIPEIPTDPQFHNVQPWPFPAGFGDLAQASLPEWRCATYQGDQAAQLLSVLGSANQVTTFDLDGTEYRIIGRPLLPGEAGCG